MAKSQITPKPELHAALFGWWNIIHMYESMHELWILSSNLGFPHTNNVDRTFAMITQYIVTCVKFGNTNLATYNL